MRLSLLGASIALAAGLALSACSSGSGGPNSGTSSVPSSAGPQVVAMVQGHKYIVRPAPGVKMLSGPACGSQYSFCFYVVPGDVGPYVSTSDGSSPLYNVGYVVKAKNNKLDKKFHTYFYPDPGDPTSQYIDYKGKVKKTQAVKYTDVYCISFTEYGCAYGTGAILYLGIALTPS
ncbi:MAG: hypothetical protein ABSF08_04390 [Candidatus Cybelea sp.]